MSDGQARLKPSPGSFFVASMPRPEQSGLEPSAGGLRPDKTGKHPDSSGFEPYCAGCHPDRAGFIPDQSGLAPDDPGLYPDDSGFEPDRNGLRPETAGLSKNPCFCHFSSKLAATAGFRGILRGSRRDESAATAGHPVRDGDCEKIRAGISAAARRVRTQRKFNKPLPIRFAAFFQNNFAATRLVCRYAAAEFVQGRANHLENASTLRTQASHFPLTKGACRSKFVVVP